MSNLEPSRAERGLTTHRQTLFWKVGFLFGPSLPDSILRGGYNHSGLPFADTETFFNLLAPAVTQDHLHLGATFSLKNGKEISLAYVHAFDNTLHGVHSIPPSFGGGNANLRMYQNSFQVGFGWNKDKK